MVSTHSACLDGVIVEFWQEMRTEGFLIKVLENLMPTRKRQFCGGLGKSHMNKGMKNIFHDNF
jgi:hypothetical protein